MDRHSLSPHICNDFGRMAEVFEKEGITGGRVMIAADSNTAPLYAEQVKMELSRVFREVHLFVFRAGEEYKTLESAASLLHELLKLQFDRKDCIAALGGGVTGDMAGFAAAVYRRGIRVIQIPTTLLAQIDSSIGGKTGVDFEGYKNMIGAFHMPSLIYTNTDTLLTLPAEQFTAGMGEVIKSALLADSDFFAFLVENREKIAASDRECILEMIRRCAAIKVKIVLEDPTEQGVRALLNLGHTIGHAVEKATNFTLLHGEAVGAGLKSAAAMSLKRGLISKTDYDRICSLLAYFGLPLYVEGIDPEEILHFTKSDKKMADGQIRFILLKGIGEAFYTDDVSDEELMTGINVLLPDKDKDR